MQNILRAPYWCMCVLIACRALPIEPSDAAAWNVYETPLGGNARVGLNKDATVHLNTNTRLRTSVVGTAYEVTIERGEAFFHVGGSPLRIVVHDVSISATDSSFDIRDYGNGSVDIVPLKGLVHIDSVRADQVVLAGQLAAVQGGRVALQNLGRSTLQRKVMWRSGMLEFVDESVEDIVAEFNRYNRTRLKVEDPAIGCRRIGGRFLISDIDGFVATLGRVVDMRAETSQESSGTVVHLVRRTETAAANARACRRGADREARDKR